jgi:hypothetical protein
MARLQLNPRGFALQVKIMKEIYRIEEVLRDTSYRGSFFLVDDVQGDNTIVRDPLQLRILIEDPKDISYKGNMTRFYIWGQEYSGGPRVPVEELKLRRLKQQEISDIEKIVVGHPTFH